MKTSKGHLTYCTNIHAGENWPDHFAALQANFPAIKNSLSPHDPMGIGLRLSNIASIQLSDPEELEIFKEWLFKNNAYVFTMNGFPYGGFHNTVVKDQVHAPDWLTSERLNYTIRLFDLLAELLPAGMDGGISTSPLSYRHWFNTPNHLLNATIKATQNILQVVSHLADIHSTTGKLLHLDIEPEPDGILETGEEFLDWYEEELLPAGVHELSNSFSISELAAEKLIKDHICLCYDICHFAIGSEPHEKVIQQLKARGIKIGKFQVSAALKANMPEDAEQRNTISNAFSAFNEPTYLHQVIARKKDNDFIRYRDLPDALADAQNTHVTEWRAHFHVPIFEQHFGVLQSTQSDIIEVLGLHKAQHLTHHLEVETYTWEVLDATLKLPIQQSIIREMKWLQQALHD